MRPALSAVQVGRLFDFMRDVVELRRRRLAEGRVPRSLPTGIPDLDNALAAGGTTVIQGGPATGKTSLALHLAGAVVSAGGSAAWIDVEGQLHAGRLAAAGIPAGALGVLKPAGAGEALQSCRLLAEAGVDLVVLDPVAGLLPLLPGAGAEADLDGFRAWLARELGALAAARRASGTRLLLVEHQALFQGEEDLAPRRFTAGGMAALGRADAILRLERLSPPGPGFTVEAQLVRRGPGSAPQVFSFRVEAGRVLVCGGGLTGFTPP